MLRLYWMDPLDPTLQYILARSFGFNYETVYMQPETMSLMQRIRLIGLY